MVGVFNYEPLNNNTILTSGTTLFCITETGSGQITWSFQDGQSSTTTDVTSQSNWDSANRISTLYACPELTGRYSCRVTRKSSYAIYTALGGLNFARVRIQFLTHFICCIHSLYVGHIDKRHLNYNSH